MCSQRDTSMRLKRCRNSAVFSQPWPSQPWTSMWLTLYALATIMRSNCHITLVANFPNPVPEIIFQWDSEYFLHHPDISPKEPRECTHKMQRPNRTSMICMSCWVPLATTPAWQLKWPEMWRLANYLAGMEALQGHFSRSFLGLSVAYLETGATRRNLSLWNGSGDFTDFGWSTYLHENLSHTLRKLDPKWVPEREKERGSNTWHEMKGPWRLSRIEHNPWNSNKQKITNLFSRWAVPMTPGDGVPDDASPSQILLEMWVYAQEEVNTSEEQTESSQMAQVK